MGAYSEGDGSGRCGVQIFVCWVLVDNIKPV